MAHMILVILEASLYQLPFKIPKIPSSRDHKALNRATFGGAGTPCCSASWARVPGILLGPQRAKNSSGQSPDSEGL